MCLLTLPTIHVVAGNHITIERHYYLHTVYIRGIIVTLPYSISMVSSIGDMIVSIYYFHYYLPLSIENGKEDTKDKVRYIETA